MAKNLGDKMVFSEDFANTALTTQNGWTLTGTVSAGKLMTLGATRPFVPNWFWTSGGTIRMRVRFNDTDASTRRWFFMGKDANYLLQFYFNGSNGGTIIELRNGSGNNYYQNINVLSGATWYEFVVTWDKTTLSTYYNGGNVQTDASAGTAYAGGYDTNYNVIKLGSVVTNGVTDFDCDFIEFYRGAWTAEEVSDAYANSTYNEVEPSKAKVWLPLRSRFDNGSNEVTRNIGTGTDAIVGDGSTSTTYPTFLSPHGCSFDGGDYISLSSADITTINTWTQGTIFLLYNYTGNCTDGGITQNIFSLNQGSVATNYLDLCFYDPSGGGDTVDYLTWAVVPGGITVVARVPITATKGVHSVAVVVDSTGNKIYIDGELTTPTYDAGNAANTQFFSAISGADWGAFGAGKRSGSIQRYYNGSIWNPSFFDEALTPRQIRWLHEYIFTNLNI